MVRLLPLRVCTETIAVLLRLLAMARAGQIRGVAICSWGHGTGSRVALTGIYRAEAERALAAADLIKVTAGHQLDLFTERG